MSEEQAKEIARELIVYLMQVGKSGQRFNFQVGGDGKGEYSVTKQTTRQGKS